MDRLVNKNNPNAGRLAKNLNTPYKPTPPQQEQEPLRVRTFTVVVNHIISDHSDLEIVGLVRCGSIRPDTLNTVPVTSGSTWKHRLHELSK